MTYSLLIIYWIFLLFTYAHILSKIINAFMVMEWFYTDCSIWNKSLSRLKQCRLGDKNGIYIGLAVSSIWFYVANYQTIFIYTKSKLNVPGFVRFWNLISCIKISFRWLELQASIIMTWRSVVNKHWTHNTNSRKHFEFNLQLFPHSKLKMEKEMSCNILVHRWFLHQR